MLSPHNGENTEKTPMLYTLTRKNLFKRTGKCKSEQHTVNTLICINKKFINKLGKVGQAFNPAFRKLRQRIIMNSGPAWAMIVKPNLKNTKKEPGMVAHAFKPSTKEAEAGGSLILRPDWSAQRKTTTTTIKINK